MFIVTNGVSERAKMKTACFVFVFAFAMKNLCASAQQYTVHACKDGTLRLNCRIGRIQVHSVVHGDSGCYGSSCCPRQNDCSGTPSASHRNQVNAACNGRSSCSMNVEIRDIGCGVWAPSNDYTNITYSCVAIQTSPTSTIRTTTPFPTVSSSSYASTWQHSTKSTSLPTDITPYTSDKKATETEKEEGETTPQSSLDESSRLNLLRLQKSGKDTLESKQGESESQVQTVQDKDYGYLDRINTLVAVIVGGVVITVIVISVAVVLVLKKRRSVKIEEYYDMPNYSCGANNDNENENVRNSNFYDTIPEPAGNCSSRDSGIVECTPKEDEYLKPVMEREDAPYLWIP